MLHKYYEPSLKLQCSVAHRWRDTAGGRCDENHMTNESYWSEKLERSGLVIKSHCQDFTQREAKNGPGWVSCHRLLSLDVGLAQREELGG